MRYSFFYFIILIGLLFTGCGTKSFALLQTDDKVVKSVSDANYSKELNFEWKITRGDRVQIVVQNQSVAEGDQQLNVLLNTAGRGQQPTKDGTEGLLIPLKGTVRLPLVHTVKIIGLTEDEAAEKIRTAYLKYLKHPFVSVKILNQKLFVIGEVNSPGVVQVTNGTMSLFEALARSGDLTDNAKRTNVKIIRGGMRKPIVKEIDLSSLSSMTLTSLTLRPNDIVYVQPRDMKAYNIAFNEQVPFFNMITQMLAPFLTVKTINTLGATDVFLLR
jgi:polysaccharide export outer membrane protein